MLDRAAVIQEIRIVDGGSLLYMVSEDPPFISASCMLSSLWNQLGLQVFSPCVNRIFTRLALMDHV